MSIRSFRLDKNLLRLLGQSKGISQNQTVVRIKIHMLHHDSCMGTKLGRHGSRASAFTSHVCIDVCNRLSCMLAHVALQMMSCLKASTLLVCIRHKWPRCSHTMLAPSTLQLMTCLRHETFLSAWFGTMAAMQSHHAGDHRPSDDDLPHGTKYYCPCEIEKYVMQIRSGWR